MPGMQPLDQATLEECRVGDEAYDVSRVFAAVEACSRDAAWGEADDVAPDEPAAVPDDEPDDEADEAPDDGNVDFYLVAQSPFTPMRRDWAQWLVELGVELRGFDNDPQGRTMIKVRGTPERLDELFREGVVGALAHAAVPRLVEGFRAALMVPGIGLVFPMP